MTTHSTRKYTLITGCAPGGIGHSLVQTLAAPPYNHHVIATARSSSALEATLGSNPNISLLSLDVTSIDSIQAARDQVAKIAGGKLHYLVNNAGRNYTVPALDVEMEEVRLTFETNVFGVIAMCNTFAPLLIAAADAQAEARLAAAERSGTIGASAAALGQSVRLVTRLATLGLIDLSFLGSDVEQPAIVQIGSVAGIVPYVFGSVYNASKSALHGYTRTLRVELAPFGVDVVNIVTGGVKSRIARTERTLRPGSLYLPLETEYNRRVKHSQEVGMPNQEYARKVAAAFAKKRRSVIIWEGALARLVRFMSNWLPRSTASLFMWRTFHLWKLRDAVQQRRIANVKAAATSK